MISDDIRWEEADAGEEVTMVVSPPVDWSAGVEGTGSSSATDSRDDDDDEAALTLTPSPVESEEISPVLTEMARIILGCIDLRFCKGIVP